MRFASFSIVDSDLDAVLAKVSSMILERLGEHVDVALAFPSQHFASRADELVHRLKPAIGARMLVGCCGEGVIGPVDGIENEPAIAIVAAQLPGVEIEPFSLGVPALSEIARDPIRLHKVYDAPSDTRFFAMLADEEARVGGRVVDLVQTNGIPRDFRKSGHAQRERLDLHTGQLRGDDGDRRLVFDLVDRTDHAFTATPHQHARADRRFEPVHEFIRPRREVLAREHQGHVDVFAETLQDHTRYLREDRVQVRVDDREGGEAHVRDYTARWCRRLPQPGRCSRKSPTPRSRRRADSQRR